MEASRRANRRELFSKLKIKEIGGGGRELEVDVVDLSKTGIGFNSTVEITKGSMFETTLRIWTGEVIHTVFEAVRIDKKDGYWFCGGNFIGMTDTDIARIAVYDTIETLHGH